MRVKFEYLMHVPNVLHPSVPPGRAFCRLSDLPPTKKFIDFPELPKYQKSPIPSTNSSPKKLLCPPCSNFSKIWSFSLKKNYGHVTHTFTFGFHTSFVRK